MTPGSRGAADLIPFNRPYLTGKELHNIADAHARGALAGDGHYTRQCHAWLEDRLGPRKALLTHSGTAALEMAAILAGVGPGDEVIMPSYTFVSTANAFVLRGATPVFVDIRADTLNIDETKIEAAITPRTKAIVVVHYAGVACEMDAIAAIADRHGLVLIEDAAQAILATYRGRTLGSFGDFGALSFHETKNVISGEGGALLVNRDDKVVRAEIVREKGTNRSLFFRGQVDKYTWCDIGSSFLPGELTAAFLLAQLEGSGEIMARRLSLWQRYHAAFADLEARGRARRPVIPAACGHNAHMYYLILASLDDRQRFIARMRELGVMTVFHYVPLHLSPQGRACSRCAAPLDHTEDLADRLIRLPLWVGLEPLQDRVIEAVHAAL